MDFLALGAWPSIKWVSIITCINMLLIYIQPLIFLRDENLAAISQGLKFLFGNLNKSLPLLILTLIYPIMEWLLPQLLLTNIDENPMLSLSYGLVNGFVTLYVVLVIFTAASKFLIEDMPIEVSSGISTPFEASQPGKRKSGSETVWRFLLYPLSSYDKSKPFYSPPDTSAELKIGAFLIPEIWFLWHEMWGVSAFVLLIYIIAVNVLGYILGDVDILSITIISRVLIGIFVGMHASRIYYRRYGRWPSRK